MIQIGCIRSWSILIGGVLANTPKQHIRQAVTVMTVSPQVTETRTGPLGCSNYDNLDTVSSVLVHSPENKVQLQGETQDWERSGSCCCEEP